jgi:hypothetical protein
MLAPPTTGFGDPVFTRARSAPLVTVVVSVWTLLPAFVSLSAASVAVAFTVAGPGPVARQPTVMDRESNPKPPTVPKLQSTCVGEVSTQFALPGAAKTKVAPVGTTRLSRVLAAASAALLSMRST